MKVRLSVVEGHRKEAKRLAARGLRYAREGNGVRAREVLIEAYKEERKALRAALERCEWRLREMEGESYEEKSAN